MPQRILSDGILTSDRINVLTAEEEVFFYRLLVAADNFGRFDGRVVVIKSQLYPLREIRPSVISSWLAALERAGLISQYEVAGQPFLQIGKWDQHQTLRYQKVGRFPDQNGVVPGRDSHVRTGAHMCAQERTGALPEVKRSEEKRSEMIMGGVVRSDAPRPPAAEAPVEASHVEGAQVVVLALESPIEWPPDLDDVRAELQRLQAPAEFQDPGYWKRVNDWLGPDNSGVAYLAEFRRFLAWHDALPKRRQKKNLRQAFRNWLSKAESWSDQRAQRQAVRELPGVERRR